MKKNCLCFLFLFALLFSSQYICSADSKSFEHYESYGLCVVSKILNYNDNFDMTSSVDAENYNKIMGFWFGENFNTMQAPTNSTLVYDVAKFITPDKLKQDTITSFKDFGFIKKNYKNSYKMLCAQGYLDFEDEFLNPNHPLTFDYLFKILNKFENEIKNTNNFDIATGVITDAYSEGNNVVLKLSSEKRQIEFKFNRTHSFSVQTENKITPYSYNIKRGSNVKIYTIDDEIFFVSIKQKNDVFSDKYSIQKANLFLCNPHDNEIIFIDYSDGSYINYSYDDTLLVYNDRIKSSIEKLNTEHIDKNCYFIVEKSTNIIKYINITG